MRLRQAIKILEKHTYPENYQHPPEEVAALKLGIEALKCLQEIRPPDISTFFPLLPGETKE